jgi:hypothetical protein
MLTTPFARLFSAAAAFTAIAATAPVASAQQKVDRRWQLNMDGMVRIHNLNGTVTIRGWDRDTIHVTGTIASKGKEAFFGGGGSNGAKLGVEGSDDRAPLAELTIYLPARARISVRGAATTIDIRDFAGTVDATTLSGRLRIAGSPTEVMAETMDGDLEIEASPAFLRGRTATGQITWTGSSDDVTLVSVGGAISVTGGSLFRARIESISGDLKFSGSAKPDARVSFDTHGGDIALGLSKDTRAEVAWDAPSATILGITTTRDAKARGQKFASVPRNGLTGRVAAVTATSFKGRITVTQP